MSTVRCGPKSIYTQEQEEWLQSAKDEFLQGVEAQKGSRWETKFKKDTADAFVNKFAPTLPNDGTNWVEVCG
jgi:hypothetical protein